MVWKGTHFGSDHLIQVHTLPNTQLALGTMNVERHRRLQPQGCKKLQDWPFNRRTALGTPAYKILQAPYK